MQYACRAYEFVKRCPPPVAARALVSVVPLRVSAHACRRVFDAVPTGGAMGA